MCDGAELHATMASRPAADPSSPSGAPSDPPPKPETNLLSDRFVSSMLESPEMLATLHGAILNNPQARSASFYGPLAFVVTPLPAQQSTRQ